MGWGEAARSPTLRMPTSPGGSSVSRLSPSVAEAAATESPSSSSAGPPKQPRDPPAAFFAASGVLGRCSCGPSLACTGTEAACGTWGPAGRVHALTERKKTEDAHLRDRASPVERRRAGRVKSACPGPAGGEARRYVSSCARSQSTLTVAVTAHEGACMRAETPHVRQVVAGCGAAAPLAAEFQWIQHGRQGPPPPVPSLPAILALCRLLLRLRLLRLLLLLGRLLRGLLGRLLCPSGKERRSRRTGHKRGRLAGLCSHQHSGWTMLRLQLLQSSRAFGGSPRQAFQVI